MKTIIQIKSIWGSVLFEYESENNSIKKTLEKAVNTGADLTGANLTGAYLTDADLRKIQSITRICPEDGSFIGYKKASNCVVKLEIPAEAKRHNYIGGRKCRCEFAKVIEIRNSKGHKIKEAIGDWSNKAVYRTGEMVYPDSYDPNPLVECSNGIHFFVSHQEAKDW